MGVKHSREAGAGGPTLTSSSSATAAAAQPTTRSSRRDRRSESTAPSPGQVGDSTLALRVVCPSCRAVLLPPAQLFKCPCGTLLTFTPPPGIDILPSSGTTSRFTQRLGATDLGAGGMMPVPPTIGIGGGGGRRLGGSGGGGGGGGGPSRRLLRTPDLLEERILILLSTLPRSSPQASFLISLLARLPRRADGSIDATAMQRIAEDLEAETQGAPCSLIDLLPTWTYEARATTGAAGGAGERESSKRDLLTQGPSGSASPLPSADATPPSDDQRQCSICLTEYAEGDAMKTLPCLHYFHEPCVRRWLARNKECPICRVPIDVDEEAALRDQSPG